MTDGPGLEEAVKVISSPKYTTSTAERVVAELTIRTIYPLIAAAVRAEVLARLERRFVGAAAAWCSSWDHCMDRDCSIRRDAIAAVRALTGTAP